VAGPQVPETPPRARTLSGDLDGRRPEKPIERAAPNARDQALRDPLVSVVIPTRDSGSTLESTLHSLREQTYPRLEIIVTDNGSSDDTVRIARANGCRVVAGRFQERSAQLNASLQIASGRYFYRVDADFLVEPRVVEEAVAVCEKRDTGAVLIHNRSDPSNSIWAQVRRFERDMYRDDDLNVAARFIRTDLLRRLGGFDEALIAGEDYDLHRRLVKAKVRLARINSVELHVGEPHTIRDVWDKHFYYGRTFPRYLTKHKAFAVRQLSPMRPAMVRHWREFLGNPRLSLLFGVYLVVKYAAGLSGLLAELAGLRPSVAGKQERPRSAPGARNGHIRISRR
jgi:glycosyltransferase involved in cell wall biosynthesis